MARRARCCAEPTYFREVRTTYYSGTTYGMDAHQIHSIRFLRGAEVLVFEGPEVAHSSVVLEPWAYGERVPTFKVEPWMFRRKP